MWSTQSKALTAEDAEDAEKMNASVIRRYSGYHESHKNPSDPFVSSYPWLCSMPRQAVARRLMWLAFVD